MTSVAALPPLLLLEDKLLQSRPDAFFLHSLPDPDESPGPSSHRCLLLAFMGLWTPASELTVHPLFPTQTVQGELRWGGGQRDRRDSSLPVQRAGNDQLCPWRPCTPSLPSALWERLPPVRQQLPGPGRDGLDPFRQESKGKRSPL